MILHGLNKITELPETEVHLTIGSFDGVHLGHQKLINAAINAAQKSNGISAVLTFWPHPTTYLRKDSPTLTIMPPEVKNHFLEEMGVDVVVQEEFTEQLAKTSAHDFIQLLKSTFPNLKTIYAAENFHFGYKKEGDLEFLQKEGANLGFTVCQKPSATYNNQIISSSRIRKSLLEGKIEEANEMLGHPYYSTGMVIEKSTTSEYPTLNIVWRPELKPLYGVYVIRAKSTKSKEFKGIANYCIPPTIEDQSDPTLQVYLFDTSEWGPGDFLTVEWLHFIRPEQKFESKEALHNQITQDIAEAKDTLKYLF